MKRFVGNTGSLIYILAFDDPFQTAFPLPYLNSIEFNCVEFPPEGGELPHWNWGWHYTLARDGLLPTYRLRQARQQVALRKISPRPFPQPLKLPSTERTRQRTPVLYAARARWKQLRRRTN